MLVGLLLAINLSGAGKNSKFFHVDGVNILSPKGEKFFIRGTNLGNWLNPEGYMFKFTNANSYQQINQALCELVGPDFVADFWRAFKDNYVTAQDVSCIAATGANTIRLPFHYKLFTDEDYMGSAASHDAFKRIDQLVEWCRNNGLFLILDMHDCPGGQTGDNIDDSYGYPWLFESEQSQQRYIDIWLKIAGHYKNEPVILGYDLMNEPIAHYFANKDELNARLEPLYIRTVKAIRKVDKNHILMLAGAQWNGNFDVFSNWSFDDNIMYTCHHYWTPPTEEHIHSKIAFRDKTGLPMFMGETGENSDAWCNDFRQLLEKNNIGWTYWTFKRLDASSCFMNIALPDGWNDIVEFTKAPRSGFEQIRKARPSQQAAKKALLQYLENCKYLNCSVNKGYIAALGLKPI